MNNHLNIYVEQVNEKVDLVKFNGEFDKAGHLEIREQLDELVKGFVGRTLVFDFTDLAFINSEGIGYLMEINAYLIENEKRLVFVGLKSNVADVFNAIGMHEIVDIYKNISEVLA